MAVNNSQEIILKFPCTACMGFCMENTNCIRCAVCINWFHQKCAKISNKAFTNLKRNANSNHSFVVSTTFVCRFCIEPKCCHLCKNSQINVHSSLYCVTCRERICDDCNSFSSDQLRIFKETDEPYYCSYCSQLYPCKICKEQCYNDTIHAPSIMCNCCQKWLHHSCSKLNHTYFNKLGNSDQPYYCFVCMGENVPFVKISKNAFSNTVIKEVLKSCDISRNNA